VPAEDAVAAVPLFASLRPRDRKRLAARLRERRFAAGDGLLTEGEDGIALFVIEEGEVDVSAGGRFVRTLGPGDYFGEMALIDGSTRTASVTARTPVRCHGLAAWEFRALVKENDDMAWELMRTLVRRVRELGEIER
jgi:CRP/FNR family transcriptional regulator, cyclic AMP receptor protein